MYKANLEIYYFLIMFRFSLIFIFSFLYIQVALGQSQPSKYSYYVLDGSCCGGEDSDPHAVFGIEASDGYILLGKSIDTGGLENAFAVKISKRLPKGKLFLHPDEDNSFEWSLVFGEEKKRDGFNSAAVLGEYIFLAGYKESNERVIDRFLVKIRLRDGSIIWSKTFPSLKKGKSSAFESILLTSENALLLTGVTGAPYSAVEGFKSYGNPSEGNAFVLYLSPETIDSEKAPEMADWEKVYKNTLTGKTIQEIRFSKEFVLAGSTHEPTEAKLLKIDGSGKILWEKEFPQHGELTDLAVSEDGFFLSGHKGGWETGIDGSLSKVSNDGKLIWNKTFGNPSGGKGVYSNLERGNVKLIFDECWSVTTVNKFDAVLACGTGIEGCEGREGSIKKECESDPRQNWRSYLVKIDAHGRLAWEAASSFSFPEEEDSDDLPSTASEWVFITESGDLASVIDLDFGFGLEVLRLN